MITYWRTSYFARKARKLQRRMDAVPLRDALALKPELIHAAQSLKQLFLTTLKRGGIDSVAPAYGKNLTRDALPELQAKHRKPRIPLEVAVECLAEFKKLLEQTRARAFLMSGTLLGCVREQRLLAHDYDLDFGVDLADENLPALLAALAAHPGIEVKTQTFITNEMALMNDWADGHAGRPWFIQALFKNAIPLDIFTHISHRGEMFHGSRLNLWVNSVFDLAPRALYDLEFAAPVDTDTYLTENYGDWRTPTREFVCSTDTPNSRVLHSFPALKYLFQQHILRGWMGDERRQAILLKRIEQSFENGPLPAGAA